MLKLLILLSTFQLVGCAGMGIFPERTFIDEMDRESDGFWVAGRDFQTTNGDSGQAYRPMDEIRARTPASRFEASRSQHEQTIEGELRRKINALDEIQYAQFQKDSRYLANTSEKLYYLGLTQYEREGYMKVKQAAGAPVSDRPYAYLENYRPEENLDLRSYFKSRYHDSSIRIGMSKQDVIGQWGQPQSVEVAGHPKFQNERWHFSSGGKTHQVFFEGGVVHGWNLE